MGVNLIAKKEIRKTSLVLWAVSFALLMQARPLWAMNDQSGTLNVIQGTKGLRDHDYYKAELQKLEDSTRRIHQEVNRILKEFKENMEEYRKRTRGKGVIASKVGTGVKIANAEQERLDYELALKLQNQEPEPQESKAKREALKELEDVLKIKFGQKFSNISSKAQSQQQSDLNALKNAYREWGRLIIDTVFGNMEKDLNKEEKRFLFNAMDEADKLQTLEYTDEGKNTTLFVKCLTIGDGDCYFYAAFTEKGEETGAVEAKAGKMRREFIMGIQNEQAANSLKDFVAHEYVRLLNENPDDPNVPEPARKIFAKCKYNTPGYQISKIREIISADNVREFFDKIDPLGVDKTYITVDERQKVIDPPYLLAEQGKKLINIFTLKSTTNKLELKKTVGSGNPGNAINVLYDGKHFTRLFAYESEKDQCNQIFKNYYHFRYLGA